MTDAKTPKNTANAMWGGRFAAGPDAIMTAINASIGFDQRMSAQDIRGSRAHAAMLAARGIISQSAGSKPREVLMSREEYESVKDSLLGAGAKGEQEE